MELWEKMNTEGSTMSRLLLRCSTYTQHLLDISCQNLYLKRIYTIYYSFS